MPKERSGKAATMTLTPLRRRIVLATLVLVGSFCTSYCVQRSMEPPPLPWTLSSFHAYQDREEAARAQVVFEEKELQRSIVAAVQGTKMFQPLKQGKEPRRPDFDFKFLLYVGNVSVVPSKVSSDGYEAMVSLVTMFNDSRNQEERFATKETGTVPLSREVMAAVERRVDEAMEAGDSTSTVAEGDSPSTEDASGRSGGEKSDAAGASHEEAKSPAKESSQESSKAASNDASKDARAQAFAKALGEDPAVKEAFAKALDRAVSSAFRKAVQCIGYQDMGDGDLLAAFKSRPRVVGKRGGAPANPQLAKSILEKDDDEGEEACLPECLLTEMEARLHAPKVDEAVDVHEGASTGSPSDSASSELASDSKSTASAAASESASGSDSIHGVESGASPSSKSARQALVDALLDFARDDKWSCDADLFRVAGILGGTGDRRAVAPIIALAEDAADEASAVTVLTSIAQLGGPEAEGYLFVLSTGHPSNAIRMAAAAHLEEIRGKNPVEAAASAQVGEGVDEGDDEEDNEEDNEEGDDGEGSGEEGEGADSESGGAEGKGK